MMKDAANSSLTKKKRTRFLFLIGLVLFFFLFIYMYNKNKVDCNSINYEVVELPKLNTSVDINSFLENLYYNDQNIREELDELRIKEYGSEKYIQLLDSVHSLSIKNASIIKSFYKKYGNQENSDISEIALQTPWLILHHTGDYVIRKCNFKNIYKDYCLGNITENQLYLYIKRTISIESKHDKQVDAEVSHMNIIELLNYADLDYDTCN